MMRKENIWVVIPAAGVGSRMKSDTPKQYMMLNGKTIIQHTISIFENNSQVRNIIVSISPTDKYWQDIANNLADKIQVTQGGRERCDSVLNGLISIETVAQPDDWVLVHDAARPCLRHEDLALLIDTLRNHKVGGILAIPVRDTMKRTAKDKEKYSRQEETHESQNDNLTIEETVDRDNLWHALTPQMFRYGLLKDALETAILENQQVTDEASAIELAGYRPILVEGHADNLKITRPEDIELAEFYLKQQENM